MTHSLADIARCYDLPHCLGRKPSATSRSHDALSDQRNVQSDFPLGCCTDPLVELACQASLDLVFQPQLLEEGSLIQRGWRIGVVFQQFRRVDAIVGQIETRIQRRLTGAPGAAYKAPSVFRYAEFSHQCITGNYTLSTTCKHIWCSSAVVLSISSICASMN